MVVPVKCLENRIMKIVKCAIRRHFDQSIQLRYANYRNSELVYSHFISYAVNARHKWRAGSTLRYVKRKLADIKQSLQKPHNTARPSSCHCYAATSPGSSQPGKTRTPGWTFRALARILARSTPSRTRSFSIAEMVAWGIPVSADN